MQISLVMLWVSEGEKEHNLLTIGTKAIGQTTKQIESKSQSKLNLYVQESRYREGIINFSGVQTVSIKTIF